MIGIWAVLGLRMKAILNHATMHQIDIIQISLLIILKNILTQTMTVNTTIIPKTVRKIWRTMLVG
jgi:hypothetical protein